MAHLNYTVSTVTTSESPGDSVNAGTLPATATLVITPNSGYVASASSFSIGNALPPEVASVAFSDTSTAGQVGNTVQALVTFNHFIMPSTDVELLIDIDGNVEQRTINLIQGCITSNIMSGYCDDTKFPLDGTVIASNNLTINNETRCSSFFLTTSEGTGFAASNSTNTNWLNPITSNYPGQYSGMTTTATTFQHLSTTVVPNTDTTMFTTTLWPPPDKIFEITPFYELSPSAAASGYYTVNETPSNYNVDRVVIDDVEDSQTIKVDTTDIYPGMQVTGSTVTSLAPGTGYPFFFQDIRVVSVNSANSTVALTEKLTLTIGDTINFNSVFDLTANGASWGHNFPSQPHCLTKTFTVICNIPSSVDCGAHEIDFAAISNSNINWENEPIPRITNVSIDTSDISSNGETRDLTVRGNDAEFNVAIIRSDGEAYNFITGVFGGDNPVLTNQTATVSVPFKRSIVFPATSTNYTYDITITPTGGDIIPRPDTPGATIPTAYGDEGINTNGTRFVDGVSGTYNINQYAATTLTFTADDGALSGYTISSGLTAPGAWSAQGGKEWFEGRQLPVWTGTFVKDDGSVLYNDGLDDADRTSDDIQVPFPTWTYDAGDFTNATANDAEMVINAQVTGSGSATITIVLLGAVYKQPTANTTVSLQLDEFLQIKPRVPEIGGELGSGDYFIDERDKFGYMKNASLLAEKSGIISVAVGGSVEIDLRSFDEDTNKASKTLATVAGPTDVEGTTKGSLGAHSAGKVTYTANTNVTAHDVGKVISFTYKGTVSAVDSDAQTVRLLII